MQIAGHEVERWIAAFTGGGAAIVMAAKLTKMAWRGFWQVARVVIGEVVNPQFEAATDKLDDLSHYTKYHLGPNDSTKPVFRRIETIEARQVTQHQQNTRTLAKVDKATTHESEPEIEADAE